MGLVMVYLINIVVLDHSKWLDTQRNY